jgi:cyclohexanecarboxyl-CoA dehydrogenase
VFFTDDQEEFRQTASRFSRERLQGGYLERSTRNEMDRALVREMGALGLIGPDLPEEYGGLGISSVTTGLIMEEIAYGDFSMSYVQLLASLMGGMVAKHASPDIAREWIPQIITGEKIVALGLTEPRGGSDAANLQLRAEKSGNGWRLNGEKTSISFSTQADAAVVFARTGDPKGASRGVSAFFVDLNATGVTRTHLDDIGTRPVGRGSLFFDDVHVPADCIMAEQDRAFGTIMAGFDYSRGLIGLQSIGPAQASVDETWAYVREREAFGAPLVQYEGVSFPLAEAETQLTMMRYLCYQTLALRDAKRSHTSEAAMCKWYVPKTTAEIIHQCLLLHGHFAYTHSLPFHMRYNDVVGLQIGDGTAQIQKLIIAREKVGRVALQYAQHKAGT